MGWFKSIAKVAPQVIKEAAQASAPPQGNVAQPQPGGSTQVSGGGFSGMMNQLVNDANVQAALQQARPGQTNVEQMPLAGYDPAVPSDVLENLRNPNVPTNYPVMQMGQPVQPVNSGQLQGPSPFLRPEDALEILQQNRGFMPMGMAQQQFDRPEEAGIGGLFQRMMR